MERSNKVNHVDGLIVHLFNCVVIRFMQTLGLSDSTDRTESRLKSLFWSSIQTGTDVDYLGTQGYWVCTVVAILSFVFFVASGHMIGGILHCRFTTWVA